MRDNCIVIASFELGTCDETGRKRDAGEKRNRVGVESSRVMVDPIFFPSAPTW